MKKQLAVVGQVVLGVLVGNVVGKGVDVVVDKTKKAVNKKKEKAPN